MSSSRLKLIFSGFLLVWSTLATGLDRPAGAVVESYDGLDVEYGALKVEAGIELRTILTKPTDVERPPALLFVQWLSCDSIELQPDAADGWSQMLRGVITESGWAVMRTDKRGIGDSQGGPCSALDFNTELADHKMALAALRAREDVDTSTIVVFGASMGARMSAQVAAGREGVIGVIAWGGGSKTWFERMLAFDRNAMELGGRDAGEIAESMKRHARYHFHYLVQGLNPAEVAEAEPELAEVWSDIVGTSEDAHYGRPFSFHHQAQAANWTSAWGRIEVPVLIVMGEYDWFENRAGHETVARIVNRREPGLARFESIPHMDHHFSIFTSASDAFRDEGGTANARPFLDLVLPWLEAREQVSVGDEAP